MTLSDSAIQGILNTLRMLEDQLQRAIEPTPFTLYNQRDPRWSGNRLGISNRTIGSDGCLVTSMASALTDYGLPMTPAELNAWLSTHGGYTEGNKFVFASTDFLGHLKFERLEDYPNPNTPMDRMEAYLSAGNALIVEVDFNPDKDLDPHYVRYLGGGQIMDPWVGDIAPIIPRYRGRTPAEAIYRVAWYKRL